MVGLRGRAYSGLAWSAGERFGQQGVRFVIQIVLARLLAPEQFGLLAMVVVFIAVGTGITDAGFSQAIIQREKLGTRELSSVFYFNLALGLGMAAILWIVAPYIAIFYGEDELTSILRVICASIPLASLSQVHLAQLTKDLQFRSVALATFPATVISGAIAVLMALRGYGVWALAAQVVIQQALQSVILWVASPWKPTLEFSWPSLRPLFAYGSRLALATIISQIFKNIYILVIGKLFTPVDVGFYQRASAFKRMGSDNLNSIVSRVTFPLYSAMQSDLPRLRRAFLTISSLTALIFFPLMGTLAGISEPLIVTLVGEKWLPSVPYLQLLCIAGALYPLHAVNLNVLQALGHSGLILRLEIFKKILMVVILLATFRYGIVPIILGQVLNSLGALLFNSYYTRKLVGVSYGQQIHQCVGPVALGVAIFVAAFVLIESIQVNSLVELFGGLVISGTMGLIGAWVLRSAYEDELTQSAVRFHRSEPIIRILYPRRFRN